MQKIILCITEVLPLLWWHVFDSVTQREAKGVEGWIMKNRREDEAVSQMVGTILLLLIALAILSPVCMYYLSYPLPNPAPYARIVGTLEGRNRKLTGLGDYEEECDVVLTHRGGESLSLDSKVLITIGGTVESITFGDHLDSKAKEDGIWGIGERLVFPCRDITNLQVEITVVDTVSDSVIFMGIFQDETLVTTQGTFNIQYNSSTLCMDYDFKEYGSGRVRFAYKNQSEESWTYTSWIPRSGRGFYHKRVTELSCETTYLYKAQLKYDSTIVAGETKSFTTGDCLT